MSVSARTSASRRGSPAEPAAGAGGLPIAGVTAAPSARPGRGRSWRHKGWLRLISPIVVLALWQIISVTGIVSQQKLPSLTTLWSTGPPDHDDLTDLRDTAGRHGNLAAGRTEPGAVAAAGVVAPGVVAQTRGLSRSFAGHVVLDDLDLEIGSGEFVAMIGRSGTGKSTLLRALAGLDRDASGDLAVNAPVSVVFQEPRLVPWKRVWANVSLGLRTGDPRGVGRAQVVVRDSSKSA